MSAVHDAPSSAGSRAAALASAARDEAIRCSRCGFCQPACPVYRATGREAHVARGKVFLYRKIVEGQLPVEADQREAFDNCLLCRACTASCHPAVRTDTVVLAFREAYARRWGRPLVQRLLFRTVLPNPGVAAGAFRLAWRSGAGVFAQKAGRSSALRMLNPKLTMATRLVEESPLPFLRERLRGLPLRPMGSRLRVGYWISCGYNYMLPQVGVDSVRVLLALGAEVVPLPNNCCGSPVAAYGDGEAARLLARKNVARLAQLGTLDYVVSECGSCSARLKEYGALLADDERLAGPARQLSERARSFSELLVELGTELPLRPLKRTVTYHDPCHMSQRYQGVTAQPRELIRSIPGVTFVELNEADSCCGAAGTYNVLHPQVSARILERKALRVAGTEAALVATECPACLMQLALGVREHAPGAAAVSVSQLLAASLSPTTGQ